MCLHWVSTNYYYYKLAMCNLSIIFYVGMLITENCKQGRRTRDKTKFNLVEINSKHVLINLNAKSSKVRCTENWNLNWNLTN